MRLIRGVSVQSAGNSDAVSFAPQLFRSYVAWARLCFVPTPPREISIAAAERQEPRLDPHVEQQSRLRFDSAPR
jgi:hypothetical protein